MDDKIYSSFEENVEDCSGFDSDDNLRIVLETPHKKRKCSTPKPSKNEELIIKNIEEQLQKQLEEKAEKTQLNVKNVKNIIRHVMTNEDVLALIKQAEDPEQSSSLTSYEPKLTRAKAKELLSTNPGTPVAPWVAPAELKKSETHVLVGDDLAEDSSGDEYVPGEEESEDDRESSVASESDTSLSLPPTPNPDPKPEEDNTSQTQYTDDGVFKVPPAKNTNNQPNDATIALRTRSKINLSSTPLEVIEKAFIPPDITTDMYDMDCDDEEWADFLKGFMQPLDEIIKSTEDEEHDPEYNIMADDGINNIDKNDLKEELRVDKAVKISKKELHGLWDELLNCAGIQGEAKTSTESKNNNTVTDVSTIVEESKTAVNVSQNCVQADYLPLLLQQLRQCVQILTQNFLLAYEHPELHEYSSQIKLQLVNLANVCNQPNSAIEAVNLPGAMKVIHSWETLFSLNNHYVEEHKNHVQKVLEEALRKKKAGDYYYVPTFSSLYMATVAKSDVFLYPDLLPRIPFKPGSFFSQNVQTYTDSEDQLIAIGLEEFMPLASSFSKTGNARLRDVCSYIEKYMMPPKDAAKLHNHINKSKHRRCASNPIKYYFHHNKAPPTVHCITDLYLLLPPCKQQAEELPILWREFIYSEQANAKDASALIKTPTASTIQPKAYKTLPIVETPIVPKTPLQPTSTPVSSFEKTARSLSKRRVLNKPPFKRRTFERSPNSCNTATPLQNFVNCLRRSSCEKIFKIFSPEKDIDLALRRFKEYDMLPSMPCLSPASKSDSIDVVDAASCNGESSVKRHSESEEGEAKQKRLHSNENEEEDKGPAEKDNVEEINALMAASATVKPQAKKELLTGAEKKRAKMRKEFLANLAIAGPEDPDVDKHRAEMFAISYYDKMRETLELEDYHKVMQILNEYSSGDAVDLYNQMEKVLRPKYVELADEFLLFLREKEAAAVDQLIPWIQMNNRSKFLRKVDIYFKDQPAQLRKIYKCLTDLSQANDVSKEKIKSTIIPMLKGNTILIDLFLQNFSSEKPPASLMEGPYETINVNKELSRGENEDIFEVITVPDTEDKYGGLSCICNCHKIEDPEFKRRLRHCIPCGTRFIQGKVYIQTGRGPRPANVSFPGSQKTDHNARLIGKTVSTSNARKKRSDTSPSKQCATSSPSKENVDEDSEEEAESRKKYKIRTKPSKKSKKHSEPVSSTSGDTKPSSTNLDNCESDVALKDCKIEIVEHDMENHDKYLDVKAERDVENDDYFVVKENGQTSFLKDCASLESEVTESELNGSGESTEKPGSPGIQTADSESEFCEESSQDNCESDCNSSDSSSSCSQSESESWTREEDRIILETFQGENDKEYAFKIISGELTNRTIKQIRSRFSTLMSLLLQQIGDD